MTYRVSQTHRKKKRTLCADNVRHELHRGNLGLIKIHCENESGSANFDDFSYSAANYHKLKLQLLESKMTALRGRINSMPIKRPPKVFGHAIHDSGRSSYLNVVVREHLDGHPGYLTQNDVHIFIFSPRYLYRECKIKYISIHPINMRKTPLALLAEPKATIFGGVYTQQ